MAYIKEVPGFLCSSTAVEWKPAFRTDSGVVFSGDYRFDGACAALAAEAARFAAACFSALFNAIQPPANPRNNNNIVALVRMIVLRGMVGSWAGNSSINSVIFPQWGHSIFVSTASAGNSRRPPHDWQLPFKYFVVGIKPAENWKPDGRLQRLFMLVIAV